MGAKNQDIGFCGTKIGVIYFTMCLRYGEIFTKDVMRRIGLPVAAEIVRKLWEIWSAADTSKRTKVCLCQSLVGSHLLCSSGTCALLSMSKSGNCAMEVSGQEIDTDMLFSSYLCHQNSVSSSQSWRPIQ